MSAEFDVNTMREKRDIKTGIKSDKEFFDELKDLTGRIDNGWLPEKPVERIYFDDLSSLLNSVNSATPEA
jgi:hypothetical protein